MEKEKLEASWFEFLLNPTALLTHLSQPSPAPSALTLLEHFIVNGEKCSETLAALIESQECLDDFTVPAVYKKSKALKMLALETIAFLKWNLDEISKLEIHLQHCLMKVVMSVVEEAEVDVKPMKIGPSHFLRTFYHRWVLRTVVSRSPSKPLRLIPPVPQTNGEQPPIVPLSNEDVIKVLDEEESKSALHASLSIKELKQKGNIKVPNIKTFSNLKEVDWKLGDSMKKEAFLIILNLELGIYSLYRGRADDAHAYFKNVKLPVLNCPYYTIKEEKLKGYLAAVGLEQNIKQEDDNSYRDLHNSLFETSVGLKRYNSLNRVKNALGYEPYPIHAPRATDKLSIDKQDREYSTVKDDKLKFFMLQKTLIESSSPEEIKTTVMSMQSLTSVHDINNPGLIKLFSGWELPIPIQHSTSTIPHGPFLDYINVLIAKAKQLFNANIFEDSKILLNAASHEIRSQIQSNPQNNMSHYVYNLNKLSKMLEWEMLLVEISENMSNRGPKMNAVKKALIMKCRETLSTILNPGAEVNPRSEIVEMALMTMINLEEYSFVDNFDKNLTQRWPFVEFLCLLSRVCDDMRNNKEASSSYRELWTCVLPIFFLDASGNSSSSSGGPNKKGIVSSSKSGILSSKSVLTWVIDRIFSETLLSLWVSLLARLHNHVIDDIALQIECDLLNYWPNILDSVGGSHMEFNKTVRSHAVSKIHTRQIREFLVKILEKTVSCTLFSLKWLKCLGNVYLAANSSPLAMKCYVEYIALSTDYFEDFDALCWADDNLFKRMIKCCEQLQCFTQAVVLCQFTNPVDYTVAFGLAQEKVTYDAADSLYAYVWDLTILEFLINLHSKRNEPSKLTIAKKTMGLLELNSNNNEDVRRDAIRFRKSQFLRTLSNVFVVN